MELDIGLAGKAKAIHVPVEVSSSNLQLLGSKVDTHDVSFGSHHLSEDVDVSPCTTPKIEHSEASQIIVGEHETAAIVL